jgi:hypothetical protein
VWVRRGIGSGGEGIASRRDLGAKSAGRNWRN